MKNKADIVIIGGGIIGCAVAFNLAKKGMKDIVVLEKEFLASGATGRCGAGVRQQWGTRQNCLLAKESMTILENISDYLEEKVDIELKQKGYLLLSFSEKETKQFAKNLEVQHSLNIPSMALTPHQAQEIVPILNTEKIHSAAFCPTDGHANPFLTTEAYAKAAKKRGVEICTFTQATAIKIENGKIKGVQTDKGFIETERVLNAAGGWAYEIGKMAGLKLPVFSERHEILVTEKVPPMLDPMVMSFSFNIYCQQTPNGSFVMGHGPKNEKPGHNVNSTWQFLEAMAQKVTYLLPAIKKIRVVRQWAGSYNISPDRQPIICESEQLPGYYMAVGFSGHGFMLGPSIGVYLSELITGETPSYDVTLDLGRFARNESIAEPSVV